MSRKAPAPTRATPTRATPSSSDGAATHSTKKGEGDYESAERYQREAKEFAESGRVEEAAEEAKRAVESDGEEADDLAAAEVKGRSRARGDDA